jgi:hypothetical protein
MRGEGAADQWAEHRRYPIHGTEEALVLGPLVQRNSVDNNDKLAHRGVSKFGREDRAAQRRQKGSWSRVALDEEHGKLTTPD